MPTGFENKKSKTKASFAPSIDSFEITTNVQEYFTQIKDPRVERTRYHLLTDIITIAILAVRFTGFSPLPKRAKSAAKSGYS